jgi:hypothetical protein
MIKLWPRHFYRDHSHESWGHVLVPSRHDERVTGFPKRAAGARTFARSKRKYFRIDHKVMGQVIF